MFIIFLHLTIIFWYIAKNLFLFYSSKSSGMIPKYFTFNLFLGVLTIRGGLKLTEDIGVSTSVVISFGNDFIFSFKGALSIYFIGLPNESPLLSEYSISSSNSELSYWHIIPTMGKISGVNVLNLKLVFGLFYTSMIC